jgi:DNA-binding LacI/PurR family transcriptional regulator
MTRRTSDDEALHLCITRELRRQIMTGQAQPGSRMATEPALAEQYGVSVLPIRQAQQALVNEQLIAKRRGRGTFVTDVVETRRRLLLVCGLQPVWLGAAPYYVNSIRFCQEYAATLGIRMDTCWIENFPEDIADIPRLSEEIGGIVFLACKHQHPLLQMAREEGYPRVNLGKLAPAANTVWFDIAAAVHALGSRLADSGARNVYVLSSPMTEALFRRLEVGPDVTISHRQIDPANSALPAYERRAYEVVRTDCAGDTADAAFVFADDIAARGGTRALLEAGIRLPASRVYVVCGQQEAFPYGMPVTYVTHDTALEARWAVDMVVAQLNDEAGDSCRQSPFTITSAEEWHEHSPAHLEAAGVVV